MSKLTITPQSGTIEQGSSLNFRIEGIENENGVRFYVENATHMVRSNIEGSVDGYLYLEKGVSEYKGILNANVPIHSAHAAISLFSTIEAKQENDEYKRVELNSSVYFVDDGPESKYDGVILLEPQFVGPFDRSRVYLEDKPNSRVVISVNDKRYVIQTDDSGKGSVTLRAEDFVDNDSIKVMQRFHLHAITDEDNYVEKKSTGSYIHVLPSKVATLADCTPDDPTDVCIATSQIDKPPVLESVPNALRNFDPSPFSVGDDSCVDEMVLDAPFCSIYDSDTTILGNGQALVAGVGLQNSAVLSEKVSRVFTFIDDTSSSADRVFFNRFGTIPVDGAFFDEDELFVFVDDNTYAMADAGWQIVIENALFNNEIFKVASKLAPGDAGAPADLPSKGFKLTGLKPDVEEWLVCVPYSLTEPDGCLPQTTYPTGLTALDGTTNGVILPKILNIVNNVVNPIKVSISATSELETVLDLTYVYVVAEAISAGTSQLFLYSFVTGAGSTCNNASIPTESSFGWHQLTFKGENKNPQISVDRSGNLHIFWESDRSGRNQVYFGVLGPSSFSLSNTAIMSVADKQAQLIQRDADDQPLEFTSDPILKINNPSSMSIVKNTADQIYQTNDQWVAYESDSSNVQTPTNKYVRISGNPVLGQGMAFTKIDQDPAGTLFSSGLFKERSFSMSFILKNTLDAAEELTDSGIDDLWEAFKNGYTEGRSTDYPGSTVYTDVDGNRFILGREDRYFDRIVPIFGSYKNEGLEALYDEQTELTEEEFVAEIQDDGATLRSFMVGLMPEKVRFEATNTQGFDDFCAEQGLSSAECLQDYVPGEESIVYTGRYKLFVVINADKSYIGNPSKGNYVLTRQFAEPFTLNGDGTEIRFVQHYKKMYEEDLVSWFGAPEEGEDTDKRFIASIAIGIGEELQFAESFVADLSDQYRDFDIALGFPSQGRFISNDFQPYETMVYDNNDVNLEFTAITIGAPSVSVDNSIALMPTGYRRWDAINVPDAIDETQAPVFADEFDLLSLGVQDLGFAQIPITLEGLNKSVSIASGFSCGDNHIAWESNRDLFWNIFYSHSTDRAMPFRFDTRITNTQSQSLMPSVSIDPDGNRFVAWHDNREDGRYQIFGAKADGGSAFGSPICSVTRGDTGSSIGSNCFGPVVENECGIEFSFCFDPCDFYRSGLTCLDECSTLQWCDPTLCAGGDCDTVIRAQAAGGTGNEINCSRLIVYQCASHNGSSYSLASVSRVVLESFYGGATNTRLDATDGPFFSGGPGIGTLLNDKPFWFAECGVGGTGFSTTFWDPVTSELSDIYDCVSAEAGGSLPTAGDNHTLVLHFAFKRNENQTDADSEVRLVRAFVYECTIPCTEPTEEASGCFEDAFTGADSTNLEDHVPTVAGTWVSSSGAGHWQIDGNTATQKTILLGRNRADVPNNPLVYQAQLEGGCPSLPQTITGDITINNEPAIPEIQCGFVCRYQDANNYWIGCVATDNSGVNYTQILEISGGVWTKHQDDSHGVGLFTDGQTKAATLTNTETSITFSVVGVGSSTHNSADGIANIDSGIYAETKDFATGPDGQEDTWKIDDFKVVGT